MKREYPATTQDAPILTFIENSTPSVVIRMSNSWEVLQGYYLEKIQELNNRLRELNIMENAREISGVCHEIIRAKKTLQKLNTKTGYLA
ncbi:MAG: hypothetical protein J7621_17055 [Niastella sp.]|nr:hypothetical protein [Niastella sp.]